MLLFCRCLSVCACTCTQAHAHTVTAKQRNQGSIFFLKGLGEDGEMALQPRAYTSFSEEQSLTPSTHTGQSTIPCNSVLGHATWVSHHWTTFLAIGFVWWGLLCSSGWSGTHSISAFLPLSAWITHMPHQAQARARSCVFHSDPMIRLGRRLGQWFSAEDCFGSPEDTDSEPLILTPASRVGRS